MRLVGEHHHAVLVCEANDLAQVRADAVVRRIVGEHGLRVGMAPDGVLDFLDAHAERDAEGVVHLRIDVDRHCAAEDQRVDGAAVHIARHDDFVAAADGRQHHRLHGRRRAADHEERMCRAKGLRRELLRIADDRDGMTEIVEHLHRVDIDVEALLPEEVPELRIAAAALVARHVKGHEARTLHALERLEDRRAVLSQISSHFLHFLIVFFIVFPQ